MRSGPEPSRQLYRWALDVAAGAVIGTSLSLAAVNTAAGNYAAGLFFGFWGAVVLVVVLLTA